MRNGKAFGGGILRSHEGTLIAAFYKEFGEFDVLEAEGLSLLYGLQLCAQREVGNLLVEVDLKTLVTLVNSPAIGRWPLCNYIHQICWHLLLLSASFTHVFQEANPVADALASLQLDADRVFTTIRQLPDRVRSLVYMDCISFPFVRSRVIIR